MSKVVRTASRMTGFDKPTVWTIMTPLAVKTKSINLGQGFPSWSPPDFYLKHLREAMDYSTHQYGRAFGILPFTKAIAEFHKPTFGEIDHENEICVVSGGVEGLYCSIMGVLNPGEEAILFDPSYDCYRPQIQMAGGKTVGIPLIPRKVQTKAELLKKTENKVVADEDDEWDIDYVAFEKCLNEKSKILIINSPHNPVGKVFTTPELQKVADILKKFPKVVVIEDNVYEGSTFDNFHNKPLPKIAYLEGMRERTISVYSLGKILSATGMRSGWIVGPKDLISAARSVHQFNVYCHYGIIENAARASLEDITKPGNTYLEGLATKMCKSRDLITKELLKAPYDFSLWIPKGGSFILADITRCDVKEQYFTDDNGNKRTRDYAFAAQLVDEKKVVCIPMSGFYDAKDSKVGEKFVRFAFCKDPEIIMEASERLQA